MDRIEESCDLIAGWHARQAVVSGSPQLHAMSVDVEDYFQVEALSSVVSRANWEDLESRVVANVDCILELFERTGTSATFFTLGWVARRSPEVVRRIVAAGHELASHGLEHNRADCQTRDAFLEDARSSRLLLEDVGGVPVKGYRAASFSITHRNLWAFDVLDEAGYAYSSSTYPIRHDLYGMPDQPRFAFYPVDDRRILEIPVTTCRRFGSNWPCGGGGYFRLLPYALFRANLRSSIRKDGQPCNFYFHPWEIDPGQPRFSGLSLKSRTRHYLNLGKTYEKLAKLLTDFRWRRIDQVYPVTAAFRTS